MGDDALGFVRPFTTEELAEEAFLKEEYLRGLMMANTPTDFDERKKAFIELSLAREAAVKARAALDERTSGKP